MTNPAHRSKFLAANAFCISTSTSKPISLETNNMAISNMGSVNNTPPNTELMSPASDLAATMTEPQQLQIDTNTSNQTGFLDLPAELRNRIYELALSPKFVIDPNWLWEDFSEIHELGLPGVLQVCQQIRAEAMGIWLGDTTFVFQGRHSISKLLHIIGEKNASQLKRVQLDLEWGSLNVANKMLQKVEQDVTGSGLRQGVLETKYGDDQVVIRDGIEVFVHETRYTRTPPSD